MSRLFSSDNDRQLALLTHDLRNTLTIARGHTQLVQRRLERGGPVDRVFLERCLNAIEQALGQATRRLSDMDGDGRRPDGAMPEGDER